MNPPTLSFRSVAALLILTSLVGSTLMAQPQPAGAATPDANAPGVRRGMRRGPMEPAGPVDPNAAAYLQKLGKRPIRVHDPSTIVQCKDRYWLFCTGQATPSYYSKDLITWERGPVTFKSSPEWVAKAVPGNRRGLDFWAPDVRKVGNRYLLYFSVSTFGKNTSAIGLATNATLDPCDPDYAWKDQGLVIQSDPNCDFNTIDPAVTEDEKGGLWLTFGSFWGGIKLIQLDLATGKRIAPNSPIYPLAHYDSIEAPFIYNHDGVYYLFLNWGMCCRGLNSTYNMRVGRSLKITGPYLDKDNKDMLDGGGTLLLGTDGPFIGPGHAGILKDEERYWLSMHFYDGTQRGSSALAIRPLKWSPDGWPVLE